MGRLIPEALYSNELVAEHLLRDERSEAYVAPESDPTIRRWNGLAQRIRKIDPTGEKSLALLREVEAKARASAA
jgi:hypothetical protein